MNAVDEIADTLTIIELSLDDSPSCEINHSKSYIAEWAGDTCAGEAVAKLTNCKQSRLACDNARRGLVYELELNRKECGECDRPVAECWTFILV